MPRRKIHFANGEFYHLFNRSIFRQPIFSRKRDAQMFLNIMQYYKLADPPIKFSYFRKSPEKYTTNTSKRIITIISYCLMPNHFHITVRQEIDNGVHNFMLHVLNSYSHYYRIKYQEHGPLFESIFHAVHIETDEQLLHLSRYQHLNPVTGGIVKHPNDYPFSSYQLYMNHDATVVDSLYVMSNFTSVEQYEKFVLDRKAYQQELDKIKHLLHA